MTSISNVDSAFCCTWVFGLVLQGKQLIEMRDTSKYLELKPSATLFPPPENQAEYRLYSDDHTEYFLASLTNPRTFKFRGFRSSDHSFMGRVRAKFSGAPNEWYNWVFIRLHSLLALRSIGLDVYEGLKGLLEVSPVKENGQFKFPTYSIIVRDAELASQYVNIGVQVDPSLDIKLPRTWDEAARQFLDIKTLIDGDDHGLNATEEQIQQDILECTDDIKRWITRRELFRSRVRAKYEDNLFEMTKRMEFEKLEKRSISAKGKQEKQKAGRISKNRKKQQRKQRRDGKALLRMEMDAEDRNDFKSYMLREERQKGAGRLERALKQSRRELAAKRLFGRQRSNSSTPSVSSESDSDPSTSSTDSKGSRNLKSRCNTIP